MRPAQQPKRARHLRSAQTEVERELWFELRNRRLKGFKFRRQAPIGRYIVELDGGRHATRDESTRTQFLETSGWHVLRFWNSEVIENLPGVLERIAETLARRSLSRERERAFGFRLSRRGGNTPS